MIARDFYRAVEEGRQFVMRKYLRYGEWSAPQVVSAERALAKSRVRARGGYCPYWFEIAQ
jgi:hypothetical protein